MGCSSSDSAATANTTFAARKGKGILAGPVEWTYFERFYGRGDSLDRCLSTTVKPTPSRDRRRNPGMRRRPQKRLESSVVSPPFGVHSMARNTWWVRLLQPSAPLASAMATTTPRNGDRPVWLTKLSKLLATSWVTWLVSCLPRPNKSLQRWKVLKILP